MQLLHIYNDDGEKDLVEDQMRRVHPPWRVLALPEEMFTGLREIQDLVEGHHDAILVHLTLRNFLSLKLAELAHSRDMHARLVLLSLTRVQRELLQPLFDGVVHLEDDRNRLGILVNQAARAPRGAFGSEEAVQDAIVSVINRSRSLRAQVYGLDTFRAGNEEDICWYDYLRVIHRAEATRPPPFVLIRCAADDVGLAADLRQQLLDRKVRAVLRADPALVDLADQEELRLLLRQCTVLLCVARNVQPRMEWLVAEAGAAFALDRPMILASNAPSEPLPASLTWIGRGSVRGPLERSRLVHDVVRVLWSCTGGQVVTA